MADFTKCVNADCPIRTICFRWTAKPSEYHQYWGRFEYDFDKDSCEFQIPLQNLDNDE